MADALSPGLSMKSLDCFLRPFQRWTSRCEVDRRQDTENDGAVKMLVLCKVFEHRIGTTAGLSELDRAFAEAPLEFIEIQVEPRPRVANDHKRFRLDVASCLRPKIGCVV